MKDGGVVDDEDEFEDFDWISAWAAAIAICEALCVRLPRLLDLGVSLKRPKIYKNKL